MRVRRNSGSSKEIFLRPQNKKSGSTVYKTFSVAATSMSLVTNRPEYLHLSSFLRMIWGECSMSFRLDHGKKKKENSAVSMVADKLSNELILF